MADRELAKRDREDGQLAQGAAQLPPGAVLQRMQTPFCTAISVQKPRQIEALCKAAEREAAMMEDFRWHWPITEKDGTKKELEGVSIEGAMLMMRHWGNCSYTVDLVQETSTHWVFGVSFLDFENGVTVSRLFQCGKEPPRGQFGGERWNDLVFSRGQSKAIRNAIVAAMPSWFKDRCMAAAKKCAEKRVEEPDARQKELDSLAARAKKLGLTSEDLFGKTGKRFDKYTASDIVTVKSLLRSIEQGECSVQEMFGSNVPPATGQPAASQPAAESKSRQAERPADKPRPQTQPADKPKPQPAVQAVYEKIAAQMATAQTEDALAECLDRAGLAAEKRDISSVEFDVLREVADKQHARIEAAGR